MLLQRVLELCSKTSCCRNISSWTSALSLRLGLFELRLTIPTLGDPRLFLRNEIIESFKGLALLMPVARPPRAFVELLELLLEILENLELQLEILIVVFFRFFKRALCVANLKLLDEAQSLFLLKHNWSFDTHTTAAFNFLNTHTHTHTHTHTTGASTHTTHFQFKLQLCERVCSRY